MKPLYFITIFFITLFLNAQDQKGYYITNTGQRTDGYFKTSDFQNPKSLEFSSGNGAGYTKLDPENISEYGINGQFKLVKHSVRIDKSDLNIKKMSVNKDPAWIIETVFLNVLQEGDATLYSYSSDWGMKYFYSVKSKNIEPTQLVYKKYKPSENTISENVYFRQQLFNDVRCDHQLLNEFLNIKYSKSDLLKVIGQYNSCNGSEVVSYSNSTGKKIRFKFSLVAGVYNTSFGIGGADPEADGDSELNFGFGAEIALVLPSDDWEFFLRGEYEPLSAEATGVKERSFNTTTYTYKIDSQVFNFYVGPRYNFIINSQNKIFIDAALGLSLPSGDVVRTSRVVSKVTPGTEYEGDILNIPLSTPISANLGVGYVFNNKYGIVLKYESSRNMFTNSWTSYTTKISRLGLNLRYTF